MKLKNSSAEDLLVGNFIEFSWGFIAIKGIVKNIEKSKTSNSIVRIEIIEIDGRIFVYDIFESDRIRIIA